MFDSFNPIDTDTHITEPRDVWTARVASKWGERIPHIRRVNGEDFWFVGDQIIHAPGWVTMAGIRKAMTIFPPAPSRRGRVWR